MIESYLFQDSNAFVNRFGQSDQCRHIVFDGEADEFPSRVLEESFEILLSVSSWKTNVGVRSLTMLEVDLFTSLWVPRVVLSSLKSRRDRRSMLHWSATSLTHQNPARMRTPAYWHRHPLMFHHHRHCSSHPHWQHPNPERIVW
jgi:hypothetical protein